MNPIPPEVFQVLARLDLTDAIFSDQLIDTLNLMHLLHHPDGDAMLKISDMLARLTAKYKQ